MPTYQYACTQCAERLEVVQSFSDEPLTTCPACSGRLRKVFSAVGVVFKGSGFYKTDSRTGSGKSDGGSKPDGGGKSDSGTKSDTATPAATSPSTSSSSSSSGSPSSGGSSSSSSAA